MLNISLFARKIGLDKSIAYSSGARVIQAIAGVGSLFFIGTFLTGIEQGFFFTFNSILALQVFFELGLTGIITQYVAHESSHLILSKEGLFLGENIYKSRLASLVNFCLKWYFIIGIIVFIFLLIVGFIFFDVYGELQNNTITWKEPWILLSIATGLKLFQSPLAAILTGIGFVKEQSKIIFYQQIIQPLSIWLGLYWGIKLYVIGIGYILSVLIWFIMSYKMGLVKILIEITRIKVVEKVSYVKEIFPYQWKISLSWISGYFTFQLFNPVLFATEGAIIAGQMGMTLQALNAISAFSMSWLNTKIPTYSKLIALKEYFLLDTLFKKTLFQMISICIFMLVAFYVLIIILRITNFTFNGSILADRFLDYFPMLFMIVPVLLQQFINSWATYLRCHKREPYLILSIFGGVSSLISTIVLGKLFGLYGIVIGYCTIVIISFPWAYRIYRTSKFEWHKI